MSNEPADSTVLETSFQIDSIVPTADPTNGSGQWVRYVISQGPNAENAITGLRQGTLDEAVVALRDMVEKLNERCGKLAKKKK
ncbi:MAG TPA: hypothetical protein VIL28_11260 [Steroidobacteraceae bacterium]|jgi:hypothetical protein